MRSGSGDASSAIAVPVVSGEGRASHHGSAGRASTRADPPPPVTGRTVGGAAETGLRGPVASCAAARRSWTPAGLPAWLAGVVGSLAHDVEHVPDAEHGRGSLPVPDAPPAPAEGPPVPAYLPGDAVRSPPSVEKVLAPTRTAPARTTGAWPVVRPAPVLDEAEGSALAPPLRGGAVPAFGATWHGSGDG